MQPNVRACHAFQVPLPKSDSDSNSYSDSESLIIGIVNIRQSLAKIKSAEWSLSRRPVPLWSFLRLTNPTNPKRDNVARLTWHSPNSSVYNIPDFNLYGLIKLPKTCLRCKIDRSLYAYCPCSVTFMDMETENGIEIDFESFLFVVFAALYTLVKLVYARWVNVLIKFPTCFCTQVAAHCN